MGSELNGAKGVVPDPAGVTQTPCPGAEPALGEFLRARRAVLTPDRAGIVTYGERRVPGLRREELAELAGISVPYLTRLEQGRDRHPSPQVLAALAASLDLDAAETRYLHRLAEPPPPSRPQPPPPVLSPAVRDILDSLADRPALVLSPYRDVLAATPLATAVCPGFTAGQNILRYIFLDPASRNVYINWSEVAVEAVRTLRAAADPATRDDSQRRMVRELTAGSREFATLWARHEVREKTIGEKRFRHPLTGEIALTYTTLAINDSDRQILSVYRAAPGSQSQHALQRLQDLQYAPTCGSGSISLTTQTRPKG
jgi:transcriptional regulator with XRE-family HTH domain